MIKVILCLTFEAAGTAFFVWTSYFIAHLIAGFA